jgi:cytochrome c553
VLLRGQERYDIYCSMCHGYTGAGDGMVVQRGFPRPASFHEQRLLDASVGYYFNAMTNGFGRMYSYAGRIPAEDRWAIAAYVKALQLSQNATIDDVPADVRRALELEGSRREHPMTPSVAVSRPLMVALGLGVVGLGVGAVVGLAGAASSARYLMAFMFWTGMSLGALALLAVNHMAGGSWGAVVRRPLEAMVSALPLTALFFIPVLFGVTTLYPWADPVYVAAHPLVEFKVAYLNVPWFIIRGVLYFAAWIALAWFFLRNAREQDARAGDAGRIGYRMKSVGGLAIVAYVSR